MEKKNDLDLPTLEEVLEESNVNNTQQTNIQNNNVPPITHIEEKTESTIVPVVNNEITKPQEQINTPKAENISKQNSTPIYTQELNSSYDNNLDSQTQNKQTNHTELIKRLILVIVCIGAIIIFVPKLFKEMKIASNIDNDEEVPIVEEENNNKEENKDDEKVENTDENKEETTKPTTPTNPSSPSTNPTTPTTKPTTPTTKPTTPTTPPSTNTEANTWNGIYTLNGTDIKIFQIYDDEIEYNITGPDGTSQSYAKINGKTAKDEMFDEEYIFTLNGNKLEYSDTEKYFPNGTYTKKSDYTSKDYYKDNIGDPSYINSDISGEYKLNDVIITIIQTEKDKVRFSIKKGSSTYSMTGELKNFIIDFKKTMFDDTDTIKFEFINGTIKITATSTDKDSILNKIDGTYKKSRKLTIEEVIKNGYI